MSPPGSAPNPEPPARQSHRPVKAQRGLQLPDATCGAGTPAPVRQCTPRTDECGFTCVPSTGVWPPGPEAGRAPPSCGRRPDPGARRLVPPRGLSGQTSSPSEGAQVPPRPQQFCCCPSFGLLCPEIGTEQVRSPSNRTVATDRHCRSTAWPCQGPGQQRHTCPLCPAHFHPLHGATHPPSCTQPVS